MYKKKKKEKKYNLGWDPELVLDYKILLLLLLLHMGALSVLNAHPWVSLTLLSR